MFVTLLLLFVLLLPAWQFACDCAASVRSRADYAPITAPDAPATPITPPVAEYAGITKVITAAALPAPRKRKTKAERDYEYYVRYCRAYRLAS